MTGELYKHESVVFKMPKEMVSKLSLQSNQTGFLSQAWADEYPHPEGLTTVAATV